MGEIGDIWRAVRNASQADRTKRLFQANAEFAQAKALAENAGKSICSRRRSELSHRKARKHRSHRGYNWATTKSGRSWGWCKGWWVMKRRNDYTWLVIAILPLIVYGGGGLLAIVLQWMGMFP